MPSVTNKPLMLGVIMLSVFMLSVVAPDIYGPMTVEQIPKFSSIFLNVLWHHKPHNTKHKPHHWELHNPSIRGNIHILTERS